MGGVLFDLVFFLWDFIVMIMLLKGLLVIFLGVIFSDVFFGCFFGVMCFNGF